MRERFAVVLAAILAAICSSPLLAAGAPPAPPPQGQSFQIGYDQRPEVRQFIDELVARDGFVRAELVDLFAHARYNDSAAALMNPTAASPPPTWSDYRARFVEPGRIDAGARFWRAHAQELERATRVYGVPAEVIVGILGVETLYGRNMGNYRVLDVLTTLAFDYPNKDRDRSPFFRQQLEDYLLMARDEGFDVYSIRGSYAGAIGIAQFMPGSLRHYAVDFDGDGIIDLRNSPADAIGSVANYLAQHGWQRDLPVYYPLARSADPFDGTRVGAMVARGAEPSIAALELAHTGLSAEKDLPATTRYTLVNLDDGDNPTVYLAGTRNFYVLTRYNRSYYYALAVLELGAAVRDRVDAAVAAERAGFPVDLSAPTAPVAVMNPSNQPVAILSRPDAARTPNPSVGSGESRGSTHPAKLRPVEQVQQPTAAAATAPAMPATPATPAVPAPPATASVATPDASGRVAPTGGAVAGVASDAAVAPPDTTPSSGAAPEPGPAASLPSAPNAPTATSAAPPPVPSAAPTPATPDQPVQAGNTPVDK